MTDSFQERHIGPREKDVELMLARIGVKTLDELIDRVVPDSIRDDTALDLAEALSEAEALQELRRIGQKNRVVRSMIGQGYYGTITPAVIQRNVLENPAWYTAYTPYQPEISQGRLEVLFNFQTMVTELTGLQIANASMLDEATAAAEAVTLCFRAQRGKKSRVLVSQYCHPQTLDVIRTRAEPLGIDVQTIDEDEPIEFNGTECAILLQSPDTEGVIRDYRSLVESAHKAGVMVVLATDLLALTLITTPGEIGVDVAVGSAQRLGVPMGFGGPHAAFFATTDKHKRNMPGRLVGLSVDALGNPAYRLALQTREQHIRREKATSNICTAQALLAIIATFYAKYHGPDGLRRIALRIHKMASVAVDKLRAAGIDVASVSRFDTLVIKVPGQANHYLQMAEKRGINLRLIDADTLGVSFDETSTVDDLAVLIEIFTSATGKSESATDSKSKTPNKKQSAQQSTDHLQQLINDAEHALPASLKRETAFLTQAAFNDYQSETQMMRYMQALADRDLALNRAMIPLGSCTMKLNAAAEMAAVTWPDFSDIHPFAPIHQTGGYQELISDIESMLCACTGYDAVSVQPNAGSQGEYAGLLAIKRYHESRGDHHRDVCLIPQSAHGTNPASAQLCGMRVVVVACDDNGNVDLEDLDRKIAAHDQNISAIMITYPSTHGVFESHVTTVCERIHDAGGQVYIDGANFNAMVGLARPGKFGGDVSHLNLHKTFCIPHGGGGPGVGPIGVGAHLAPFLPGHREFEGAVDTGIDPNSIEANSVDPNSSVPNSSVPNSIDPRSSGAVSAAPWGSALILTITWMYIRMMGASGLRDATRYAILNANYIASRLADQYSILYHGEEGYVAHECILDTRVLKDNGGVTVEDIAKRLIDYGFHAPTMSFPVAGTLMIEPTESEPKRELDRFCEAMENIYREYQEVVAGRLPVDDNPLCNAPHTASVAMSDVWEHPYTREQAVFPVKQAVDTNKYWPPVGRVDNVHGDKHLICTCPPIEAFAEPTVDSAV